jgi:hypothetical protein
MSDSTQEEAHSGPIKTPQQLLLAVFFSFVVPVFAIIGLVFFVVSENKPSGSTEAESHALGGVTAQDLERGIAERIRKVGTVEIRDANRPLKSGQDVFKAQCTTCHTPGAAGAPKFGDARCRRRAGVISTTSKSHAESLTWRTRPARSSRNRPSRPLLRSPRQHRLLLPCRPPRRRPLPQVPRPAMLAPLPPRHRRQREPRRKLLQPGPVPVRAKRCSSRPAPLATPPVWPARRNSATRRHGPRALRKVSRCWCKTRSRARTPCRPAAVPAHRMPTCAQPSSTW